MEEGGKKGFTMWRDTTDSSARCRRTSHSTFWCCSQRMSSVCGSIVNSRPRCGGFGWSRCCGCTGGRGGRSSFRCRWGHSLGRWDLDLLPVLPFLHHEGDESAQAHVAAALLHLEAGREQHWQSEEPLQKTLIKIAAPWLRLRDCKPGQELNFDWKLLPSAWH